jgi:transposase-like protein
MCAHSVLPELRQWQPRPLDPIYPVMYLDAIVVMVRTDGQVRNRPVYLALGIDLEGRKHVLGVWLGASSNPLRQGDRVRPLSRQAHVSEIRPQAEQPSPGPLVRLR